MPKHKQLPAAAIAYVMGFVAPRTPPGHPEPQVGRKALVGQYTRPYKRTVALDTTRRISKGARRRHKRDNGSEGHLDYSGVINARR